MFQAMLNYLLINIAVMLSETSKGYKAVFVHLQAKVYLSPIPICFGAGDW